MPARSRFAFALRILGPLALVLLAAEIFNILAFHLTMAPATIGPGLVVALLWGTRLSCNTEEALRES